MLDTFRGMNSIFDWQTSEGPPVLKTKSEKGENHDLRI
jgi:hypothetical protein